MSTSNRHFLRTVCATLAVTGTVLVPSLASAAPGATQAKKAPITSFGVLQNQEKVGSRSVLAKPGVMAKLAQRSADSADSLVGYTFKLDKIPTAGVYNRVLTRVQGESYYSVVVRSTPGKSSYIQLEKVTEGKTKILGGKHIARLDANKDYRFELQVKGSNKVDLAARVYKAGSTAPEWQTTAADESSASGDPAKGTALAAYVGRASKTPVNVATRDFTVKALSPESEQKAPDQEKSTGSHEKNSDSTNASGHVQGWGNPVFDENFNDPALPKWNVQNNWRLHQDKAITRKENVKASNGLLTIHTKHLAQSESNDNSRRYSSGYLDTIGKFSQRYGRFEVRAKLPTVRNQSRGVWPAFWLRPDNGRGNEGEIDILETYGTPANRHKGDPDPYGRSEATVHVYQPGEHNGQKAPVNREKKNQWTPQNINLNDGKFHTWTTEWTPDKITFLVDGQRYHEVTKATWGSDIWNKYFGSGKFNIRLNVQVGSSYWGTPESGKTADSTAFVIDYVRAWKYQG